MTPPPVAQAMAVGVVIPARNAAAVLGDALASLVAQTHTAWRAVVVDDGSTDATADVVRRLADRRITLLQAPHEGVAAARNRGAAAVAGEALVFLDADDWLAPDALARLAAGLEAAPASVACVGSFVMMQDGEGPGGAVLRHQPPPRLDQGFLARLAVRNLFTNGGQILVRRTAFAAAGSFTPGLSFGEDWECWLRLALLGPFSVVAGKAPVLFVRRLAGGAFRRLARDPASLAEARARVLGVSGLAERVGGQWPRVRALGQAEDSWLLGRELMRHGETSAGRAALRAAVRQAPGWRRLLLLAGAHLVPQALPQFRRYRAPKG